MPTPVTAPAGNPQGKPCDPDTGLPLVLCPEDGREKSFGKYFSTSTTGIPAVLCMVPIQRFNKKMKPYNRMLILSRNYVLITYNTVNDSKLSRLRHNDAQITHCLPISAIRELYYFKDNRTLYIRMKDHPPNPSVALCIHDAGGAESTRPERETRQMREIMKIIIDSGMSQKPPHRIELRDVGKSLKSTEDSLGFRAIEELAKPKKWKLVVPPDCIPSASWEKILEAQRNRMQALYRAQLEAEALQKERERVSEPDPPTPQPLPRTPEEVPVEPIGLPPPPVEPATSNDTLISRKVQEPREADDLRAEIDTLQMQSDNLQQQQRLHMATLGASQRIVSMLVNTNMTGGCAPGSDASISPTSIDYAPAPRGASLGSPAPLHMDIAPQGYFSDAGSDEHRTPLPPTPPDRAAALQPPPLPPGGSGVGLGGATPGQIDSLQVELDRVKAGMTSQLQQKDMHIEVLRAALQGVMEEGDDGEDSFYDDDEEEEECEEEEGFYSDDDGQLTEGGVGDEGDEEEEERWLDALSPGPYLEDFDDSEGEGFGCGNSAAEEQVQRAANSHAQSIQTRRREVEELMRQLQALEGGGGGRGGGGQSLPDERHHINALRSQLKAVLRDLEIEALSYQDAFITGLPVTQQIEAPQYPSLAHLAGGVEGLHGGGGGGGGGGGLSGNSDASYALPPFDTSRFSPSAVRPGGGGGGGGGGMPSSGIDGMFGSGAGGGGSAAQQKGGDAYWQWMQYCQYLATYYPEAYANFYASHMEKADPQNFESTSSQYSSSTGVTSLDHPQWKKWTSWKQA